MKPRMLLLTLLLTMSLPLWSDDVIVTRFFTGVWGQPDHESQGVNLQIIDQANGSKVGVAYWFTYGTDNESAWFLAVGNVVGNRIEMTLYRGSGIGFLEADKPGDDNVVEVGTFDIEFSTCKDGKVTFATELDDIGDGMFTIKRSSDLFNSSCSGGISDDTPPGVIAQEQRIVLGPAREGINGSGHADFEERADRTEFKVEVEDLADGNYRIVVGGTDRGDLVVNMGIGETEFRSPVEAGKVLLTFDPRGEVIEVHDMQGAVLTSGDTIFTGGDDDDDGDPEPLDFGNTEIEVELTNTGVYPLASGDAKLEPREDRTEFSVEIEDVPEGSYELTVGGESVGTIVATMRPDGTVEGELEFRNPVEPGKVLLNFDPRGELIEVLEGDTVIFDTEFPAN